VVARYSPRVRLREGKEVLRRLDAYDQTVELAGHLQLVISSGYNYGGGVDLENMTDTPLVQASSRGALTWLTPLK